VIDPKATFRRAGVLASRTQAKRPYLGAGQSNAQDSFRDAEAGVGRLLELCRDAFLRKFVPNSFERLTHNLGQSYYDTA
jgi:hypothetical protein